MRLQRILVLCGLFVAAYPEEPAGRFYNHYVLCTLPPQAGVRHADTALLENAKVLRQIAKKNCKKTLDIFIPICYFIMRVECPETAGTVRCKLKTPAEEHTKLN